MVLDIRKSNLGSQQWLRFHFGFIMTLNYTMRLILLRNATAVSLQNATKVYYKMSLVILLLNATFITKCVRTNIYFHGRWCQMRRSNFCLIISWIGWPLIKYLNIWLINSKTECDSLNWIALYKNFTNFGHDSKLIKFFLVVSSATEEVLANRLLPY